MTVKSWLDKSQHATLVREEEETELIDLITTCRVVSNEILKVTKDPLLTAGARLVLNQLLDLTLEKVIGDEVVQPFSPDRTFDELPY